MTFAYIDIQDAFTDSGVNEHGYISAREYYAFSFQRGIDDARWFMKQVLVEYPNDRDAERELRTMLYQELAWRSNARRHDTLPMPSGTTVDPEIATVWFRALGRRTAIKDYAEGIADIRPKYFSSSHIENLSRLSDHLGMAATCGVKIDSDDKGAPRLTEIESVYIKCRDTYALYPDRWNPAP